MISTLPRRVQAEPPYALDSRGRAADTSRVGDAAAPSLARPARPGAWPGATRPFVGRDRELGDLDAALAEIQRGTGALELITGEPGIGKTRLMAELARLAGQRGLRVVSGRCWEEGGAPPYWPWIQVVRSLGGDLEQLAEPAGSGPDRPSAVATEDERIRLFDVVARLLSSAADEQPLLVTLDDIHAADEPTLLMLRFLGESLRGSRVLLVASYRDASPQVREQSDTFAELARVGRLVPLGGLSATELEHYVGTVTGSPPSARTVSRLLEITGGNPFFLGEVVRLLGGGDTPSGLDCAARDPLLQVPEEIRALIRRRLAALPREAVTLLRVAAVLGREFDGHLLGRTSRLSPARLLGLLGDAVAAGLITEQPGGAHRYTFIHELVRETLYDDLPPTRRLRLHLEVGRLLAAVHRADPDAHLSEVARHLYLAAPLGDPAEAVDHLVRAGRRACALFAYEEATPHFRRALELWPQIEGGSAERHRELMLLLGDAQWRAGDGPEARATFERAIGLARRTGDPELLARAALGYVTALGGFLLYARFEVGGTSVGLLEEALAGLPPGDSSLRAHLLAHLALEMWSADESVERRVEVSGQAIAMARRVGDSEALVTALHSRHWALTTPGRTLDRLAHTEEMLRVAKETGGLTIEFLAHNARFHCFLELGDRRGMDAESRAMTELADRLHQPFYRWHTVCLHTLRATLDGRFADAERLAREALELGRLRQSEYAGYVFRYAQLYAIRWAQGRLDELWPEVADHGDRYPWIPRWRDLFAAVELGDRSAARRELDRCRDLTALPRDGLWTLHLCGLADACVLVENHEFGRQVYDLLLPLADDQAVSYTQQPFGPVAFRLGRLASLLGRWQDADRHFATALARCELLGAQAIRARVLIEHAAVLAGRGQPADHGRARALLDEAGQLCAELDLPRLTSRVTDVRRALGEGSSSAIFRREGEYWTIAYRDTTFRLQDLKGLRYLAFLLAAPGRDFHALELVHAAEGTAVERSVADRDLTPGWAGDAEPLLDDQAKSAYRRRLRDLQQELDEARSWADSERAARAEAEIDALTGELTRALGLGGRDRRMPSAEERARVSVTKAVRSAIRLIDRHCPELAGHLSGSVRTGRLCSYAPPATAPPTWRF